MTPTRILQFLLAALFFGSSYLLITLQLGDVNPSWSVGWRFLIGGLFLLLLCQLRGQAILLPRSGWIIIIGLAAFQFGINFNFIYHAEVYLTSGVVGAAYALIMIPNALLAAIFLKRVPTVAFIAGSVLAAIGVGLLFYPEFVATAHSGVSGRGILIGTLFTLLAVLISSFANIMQATQRARRLPALATIGWAMLLSGLVSLAYAAVVHGAPFHQPNVTYWAATAILGIFSSALAFTIYFELIRAIGPAEAAWSGVGSPIVAMLLSTLFEGYRWTIPNVAGAILALAGLVIALKPPRPASGPEAAGKDAGSAPR